MPRGRPPGTKNTPKVVTTGGARPATPQPQASARAEKLRNELFSNDFTVPELAHILDRSAAAVSGYLRTGKIVGYRIGKSWRVTEDALRQYVASLRGVSVASTNAGPFVTWNPSGGNITVPSITHPVGGPVSFQTHAMVTGGSNDAAAPARPQDQILARLDQQGE